jgi:hypothetical protein
MTVHRSQPLTVSWTGSGFDTVEILINTTYGVHDRTPIVLNCSIPASLGTYIPAAALSAISASASAQLEVTADINQGFAVSAESTTDPNTVIPLVGGGLVDFGGFGSYIAYVMTGVIVE